MSGKSERRVRTLLKRLPEGGQIRHSGTGCEARPSNRRDTGGGKATSGGAVPAETTGQAVA